MRHLLAILLVLALPVVASASDYDRRHFYGGWSDADGDCMDLRQELLARSASRIGAYDEAGCRIVRGVWIDPYAGARVLDPRQVHIDHVIPLRWAWDRGADGWTPEKRRAFALDARFLLAVSGRENRSKGAKGPLEWMPDRVAARCGYVLLFERGVRTYGLELDEAERAGLDALRGLVCEGKPEAPTVG